MNGATPPDLGTNQLLRQLIRCVTLLAIVLVACVTGCQMHGQSQVCVHTERS